MEQNNRDTKQDVEIAQLKANNIWIKEKITNIEAQVFNHIPSQLNKCVKKTDFFVGIGAVVVIQILLKFFL